MSVLSLMLYIICIGFIVVYIVYTLNALPNNCKCLDYTTWTIIKHGPVWWIAVLFELCVIFIIKHGPYVIIKKEKKVKEK